MHIIYVDESGVPELDPGSDHFVLAGVAMPLRAWKTRDDQLRKLMQAHRLEGAELHTAWMARRYPEQDRIAGFQALDDKQRTLAVVVERKKDIAKASLKGNKAVLSLRRNYAKTDKYLHLTHAERVSVLRAAADVVGGWNDVVLFGDAQRKADVASKDRPLAREHALEQVTTRFNRYLKHAHGPDALSLMVHDQHQAESTRLTGLFRKWHATGTRYAAIPHIAETPLFVDSSLTAMVQVADLVAYATRRYFDRGETDLFDRVYPRYDRLPWGLMVGLRHFTAKVKCFCRVCKDHGRK